MADNLMPSPSASQVLGAGSNVASAIAAGGFASNMATNVTGGLGSLATSLGGIKSPAYGSLSTVLSNVVGAAGSNFGGLAGGNLAAAGSALASKLAGAGVAQSTGTPYVFPDERGGAGGIASSGSFNSQVETVKGLSGSAFRAITDSFKPFKAGIPQNLKAIAQKQAQDADPEGNANIQEQNAAAQSTGTPYVFPDERGGAGGISNDVPIAQRQAQNADPEGTANIQEQNAAANAEAIRNAGEAVNLNPSLIGATSRLPVTAAGLSNVSSSLASGLNALPGGAAAAFAVVNKATGSSLSLPALTNIASVTKNASTSTLNGIPVSSALSSIVTSLSVGNSATSGSINKLSSNVPNLTKNISAGNQSLLSLASTGLSVGAAASLSASINSLNAGGANPIKMPTVAVNTTDRSELTSQIRNLLGDTKVPAPNFSGSVAASNRGLSQAEIATYDANKKEIETLDESRFDLAKAERDARYALTKAKQDLPQGDPAIPALEQAVVTAKIKLEDLDKKVITLRNEQYTLTTGQPPPSSSTILSA